MKKLILLAVITVALLWAFSPLPAKLKQDQQLAKLNQELKKEKAKNRQLKQEIQHLKKDKGYIEQVARENLGLTKPDEEAYLVVEKVKIKKVKIKPKQKNWWQSLVQQVKKLFY